jgi:hypothetical protein
MGIDGEIRDPEVMGTSNRTGGSLTVGTTTEAVVVGTTTEAVAVDTTIVTVAVGITTVATMVGDATTVAVAAGTTIVATMVGGATTGEGKTTAPMAVTVTTVPVGATIIAREATAQAWHRA